MTMSHKEALEAAVQAVWDELGGVVPVEDAAVVLRAYLDARGLVMVPKEMTGDMRYILGRECEYPFATYEEVLAAAPDPFGGE